MEQKTTRTYVRPSLSTKMVGTTGGQAAVWQRPEEQEGSLWANTFSPNMVKVKENQPGK